jgi:hypothetical protein
LTRARECAALLVYPAKIAIVRRIVVLVLTPRMKRWMHGCTDSRDISRSAPMRCEKSGFPLSQE